MSGLHFWEDPDDAGSFEDDDEYLDSGKMNNPQYSRINENIEL